MFCSHSRPMLISTPSSIGQRLGKDFAMDDYQEELLEYHAYELDPLEPADDATEL